MWKQFNFWLEENNYDLLNNKDFDSSNLKISENNVD